MHNESRDLSLHPVNPRTTPANVGMYGICGAEWLGADDRRYRTHSRGFGMWLLNGSQPVPGMSLFRLGGDPSRWADEINAALDARDAQEGADHA